MRMLQWMCRQCKKERLRNKVIQKKVEEAPIEDKMRGLYLGLKRRSRDVPV